MKNLPIGFVVALSIHSSALLGQDNSRWSELNEKSSVAVSSGKFADAEILCKAALVEAENFGPLDTRLVLSLHNLGVVYAARKKYINAEIVLRRAVAIEEKLHKKDHPDVAREVNELANVYRDNGKADLAIPLYRRALAIREKLLGVNHTEVADTLSGLGRALAAKEQNDDALAAFQRASEIDKDNFGEDNISTIIDFEEIAGTFSKLRNYESAAGMYSKIIQIRERRPNRDISLAEVYEKYADVLVKLNRKDDGESYYKRAAQIRAAHGNRLHSTTMPNEPDK